MPIKSILNYYGFFQGFTHEIYNFVQNVIKWIFVSKIIKLDGLSWQK